MEGRPSLFGPRPSGLNLLALFLPICRGPLAKTVTLLVKEIPQDLSRVALVGPLRERFKPRVLKAVQFLPGMCAQSTFDSAEAKFAIEKNEFIFIGGHKCPVLGGGPSGENVLVFHFPYEEDVEILKDAMKRFGMVVGVRYQSYPSVDVHNGTRLLRMIRNGPIPRFLDVGGYLCKVWYRGQPIVYDICGGGVMFRTTVPLRGSAAYATKRGTMLGIVQVLQVTIGGMWWMLQLICLVLLVGKVWILN